MATDSKTVCFCSDLYTATVASNTVTAITMPSITLPESSISFKRATVHVFWSDIVTVTGASYTAQEVRFALGGLAKTTITQTSLFTNSGENIDGYFSQNVTATMASQWSGPTMSCEVGVRFVLSGGTFTGVTNVCVLLELLYEYDDTSPTQVKTVLFQLPTPTATLATSKPASLETIPAFDTMLPEASKSYLGKWVLVGGNRGNNSTDASISIEMQSGGPATTALFENALLSGSHYTVLLKPTWDTSVTQTWHIWGSVATFNHAYCWAIVTYTFDASASNDVYHSLRLPFDAVSPIPVGSASLQQLETELWIAELGPITATRVGLVAFWQQGASTTNNLRLRANTADGFTAHTDAAGVLAGCNAAQVLTSSYTLARGRQTLRGEVYLYGALLAGGNFCGFWLVNYVAPKMPGGHGAHTKTRTSALAVTGTAVAVPNAVLATTPILKIPQADYFLASVGFWLRCVPNGGSGIAGITFALERTAVEGLLGWDRAYCDMGTPDAEVGTFHLLAEVRSFFKRWPGDVGPDRRDIETTRRSRWALALQTTGTAQTGWLSAQALVTYHTHSWAVNATIKGSAGGTVTVSLHREATGEKVLETTRSGDGSVVLTWFDNTELVYLVARDGTNPLRRHVSDPFLADPGVTHTLRLFHPRGKVIDVEGVKNA